jgi:peroxiredoxin
MTRRLLFWSALFASAVAASFVGYRLARALTTATNGEGVVSATISARPHAAGADTWLGIPAPDVVFETADGLPARLADYRGQIVLLNFWGSWCPPCLIEIPHLIRVQQALEELGGTVIGPAVDSGSGEDVMRFADEQGLNYPVWIASYDIAVGEFGAAGYPFTLLIDRNGVIRKRYLGPQTDQTLLRDVGALVVDAPPVPERPEGAAESGAS